MQPEDRFRVVSPEGTALDIVLGGAGSRFCAAVVDALLQLGLAVAFLVIAANTNNGKGGYIAAVAIVFVFVDLVGYHVAFETLRHGRTPGKRVMGLRVTSASGGSVRFWPSLVRNVLRIVDFLPSGYVVGAVAVLVSRKNQRVGDIAAKTLVIRDVLPRKKDRRAPLAKDAYPLPEGHETWDVAAIGVEELVVVRRFLERRTSFLPEARKALAVDLAAQLRPRVGGVASDFGPEEFLENLVAVKLRRM